jgi:hypothetical protein
MSSALRFPEPTLPGICLESEEKQGATMNQDDFTAPSTSDPSGGVNVPDDGPETDKPVVPTWNADDGTNRPVPDTPEGQEHDEEDRIEIDNEDVVEPPA